MSNIEQNLQKILTSRYGKDVRQSIRDSIHDCYEDGKAGATDLVAREQIANLVSMNNPTEGNSELQDIRVGFDGTTYESAGEAVRGQNNKISNQLDLFADASNVFLIDINHIIENVYPSWSDGHLVSNVEYFSTEYLYVKGTDYISFNGSSTSVNSICFYDINKEFISGTYVDNDVITTVPSHAFYVRLGFKLTDISNIQLNVDSISKNVFDAKRGVSEINYPTLRDAIIGQYHDVIDAIKSSLKNIKGVNNVRLSGDLTYGKYISLAGDIVSNETYCYTGKIIVEPGKEYIIANFNNSDVFCAEYNSNDEFIKAVVSTKPYKVVMSETTAYIRLSIQTTLKNEVSVNAVNSELSYDDIINLSFMDYRIIKPSSIIENVYPSWSDGHLVSNVEYITFDYINIPSDVCLKIHGVTGDVNSICFYDINKEFISGTYPYKNIVVPNNARFVRIGIPRNDLSAFYITLTKVKASDVAPVIFVSKDEKFGFTTINEALIYAYSIESVDNPVTILIYPGVYEEVLNINGTHYVNLIGVNRDECIVKDETALYGNAPIRVQGRCYVANLTVISTANKYSSDTGSGKEAWITDVLAGVKNPEWLGTVGAYAIHCDDVTNGEYTVSRFENCKMYSETFPAFGSGMQINNRIELIGCELITHIDERIYLNDPYNNGQGTLLIHGKFPEENTPEPNQSCFIKDCYIEGINSRCVRMYPSNNAPKASIVFINNTFMNNHTQSISDLIDFTFEEQYIEKCSHGNNLEFFNKKLLQA